MSAKKLCPKSMALVDQLFRPHDHPIVLQNFDSQRTSNIDRTNFTYNLPRMGYDLSARLVQKNGELDKYANEHETAPWFSTEPHLSETNTRIRISCTDFPIQVKL